ncbi:MAG: hypothetical protein JNG84_15110, partial [Archangium sp.]|nr:hypothetical protein [Archangium sp.]
MVKQLVVATLCVSFGAWAQGTALAQGTPPGWSPPPLVPASPEAPPPPPPPSVPGVAPKLTPSSQAYPYSPYGPGAKEPLEPEIGLMVSESLFGMLTAAGVTVLPYFL